MRNPQAPLPMTDDGDIQETSKSKPKGNRKLPMTWPRLLQRANQNQRPTLSVPLLASPNSSFLWIQYMSFLLQLHEVDKARKIGRQALQRIGFREEEEKLNVWMALINVELGFGTVESADKVFKEAAEYNDKQTVYIRYAEALNESGKYEVSLIRSGTDVSLSLTGGRPPKSSTAKPSRSFHRIPKCGPDSPNGTSGGPKRKMDANSCRGV